ncbi:MAG: dTDP-glucose 4,6-dehydratase [Desulfurococcaceae archaeon]
MRVLVAGGAGFIGSNFVRHALRDLGWEVLVYDMLTYAGRLENLHDVLSDLQFVRGDIADEEKLSSVVDSFRPDVVVNFAAETHVDRSINEPAPFIKTNVLGLFTILEVLRRRRGIQLVHVSTDEVYGDLWGTDEEASEDRPLRPSSPYSASKAAGDMLVMAYGRTYGIGYRIVRPCNNYGPYQHPEKLIPRTIIRLAHGKPAVIYGDGQQVRDWLYVEDCARAIASVIRRGEDGEIYNICAQDYRTVREVVELVARLMGRDPSQSIVHARPRPGEDRRYAMRCDKVRKLGWSPAEGFESGLRKTVNWYQSNEWWWRPLVARDWSYILADTPW